MLNHAKLLAPSLLTCLVLAGLGLSRSPALLLDSSAAAQEPTGQDTLKNRNVRFGLPAPAEANLKSRDAYLIDRPQYVLSYNAEKRTPNWVCWRLKKEDIGSTSRSPFEPDPALPKGISKVTSQVYNGSGFDRGHMCPPKDRSANTQDSIAVFYMTNIVPQSPNSNQRAWETLEDYCRKLAKQGKVLYIACGPAGVGGTGKNGHAERIGKGRLKVTVPAMLWKVILVLPEEDAEPRKNMRVIAVIMPNNQSIGYNWANYRVTTKEVEKLTGFQFFHTVPEETRTALLDHLDEVNIPPVKTKRKKTATAEPDGKQEKVKAVRPADIPIEYTGQYQWQGGGQPHEVTLKLSLIEMNGDDIRIVGTHTYAPGGYTMKVTGVIDRRTRRLTLLESEPNMPDAVTEGVFQGTLSEDFQSIEAVWTSAANGFQGALKLRAKKGQ
jgi:endonuclease G